jgi:ABC-type nitrate/sulfonate/bicarbonate transport system substrate-binding protein
MKTKSILFKVLFIIILIITNYNAVEATANEQIKIKVGYLAHPGYLPVFFIDHFKNNDNKIDFELVRFTSSPTMVSAFANKEIQIAGLATVSSLSLESLDPGKLKIFAISSETIDNYLTSIVILPRNNPNINTINDLKEKTIGVFPGPAARVLFSLVFEKYGLVINKNITFKELAPQIQLQALESNQVQALATYEPIATEAEVELGAIKLMPAAVESNVLSPTQGGVWIVSQEFIQKNPGTASVIVKEFNFGIDCISKYSELIPTIISKYAAVKINVANKVPIVTYSKLENIDLVTLQKHADLMYDNKVISKKIDMSKLLLNKNDLL